MKKDGRIKTLILTDGSFDHASSRIRATLYFVHFKESLNMNINWIPRIPKKNECSTYKFFIFPIQKRFYALKLALFIIFCRYDLVYIQRFFLNKYLLKILKTKRSKIIYDFDDAIYIDKPGRNTNYNKTLDVIKSSDHIIVSTRELAHFCTKEGFSKVTIITTPIDADRFKVHKAEIKKEIIIGWIGSPYTSSFLKLIEKTLFELSKKYSIKLLVIGAKPDFRLDGVKMEILPWEYDAEPDYLDKMDIGIMPLPDDKYTKGKGGYKLFQYMAAGLPVVASPIGINSEIIRHNNNGFLANSNEEWLYYLSKLIENNELREKMGLKGRDDVLEKYSRSYCFAKLSGIIKQLL